MYSEKLSCVIDSDEREEGNSSLASLLTRKTIIKSANAFIS